MQDLPLKLILRQMILLMRESTSSEPISSSSTTILKELQTEISFILQCSFKNVQKSLPKSILSFLFILFNSPNESDARKNLAALVSEPVPSPNQPGFFMANLLQKGKNASEEEKFRGYLKQVKEECLQRLLFKLYNPDYGTMDLKFWLAFSKKKFLKGLSM